MSARSKARKAALDLLYEADIRKTTPNELLTQRVTELEYVIREYTTHLVQGISEHRRRIDDLIMTYARGWDFDRMPVIDRNLLRIAIYELLWGVDIPESVAISEALELATSLSTQESATFINGVLATILSIKGDLAL